MFHGIYVPVVTPFHSDGSLDLVSLAKLCERLVADGIAGLLPLGTTGEASALDSSERALVIETCAKAVAGTNVELVVGVGTNATASTLARVEEVAQYGPDALLVVTPYYVRPSEEGILAHFLAVADAANDIDADVMLYNIPARTGRNVSTEGLLSVATHGRINGVKQAVGGIDEATAQLLAHSPGTFSVLAGDDAFIAPMCFLGGEGGVSASAHLATPLWVEMVKAATTGDVPRARELHEMLLGIVSTGFAEPNPTVFKGVLAATGEIETDFVRLPLVPARKETIDACVAALPA
jgi:4-hydroxy-tetrahydrodipicolinate synthase